MSLSVTTCSLLSERLTATSSDFASGLCGLSALSLVRQVVLNYCVNRKFVRGDREDLIVKFDVTCISSLHIQHCNLCHFVSSFHPELFALTFDRILDTD